MAPAQSDSSEIPLLRLIPLINRITEINKIKDTTLSKSQCILLIALYYRGILSMGQIASALSSSKEQATRVVAPLVDENYVKRLELPDNRKHVYVELTDKGMAVIEKFNQEIRLEISSKLDTSLSANEREELRLCINRAVELLSKID